MRADVGHIIVAQIRRAVVRPMVLVPDTTAAASSPALNRIVLVPLVLGLIDGVVEITTATGEKVVVPMLNGLVTTVLPTRIVDVHRITKLLTLAATPIVDVNRITLVLVRALPEAQLIPSVQLHAQ